MRKKTNLLPFLIIAMIALIIGLMNTFFLKPEDIGSWKNYVGLAFILIAIFNIIIVVFIIRKKKKRSIQEGK